MPSTHLPNASHRSKGQWLFSDLIHSLVRGFCGTVPIHLIRFESARQQSAAQRKRTKLSAVVVSRVKLNAGKRISASETTNEHEVESRIRRRKSGPHYLVCFGGAGMLQCAPGRGCVF